MAEEQSMQYKYSESIMILGISPDSRKKYLNTKILDYKKHNWDLIEYKEGGLLASTAKFGGNEAKKASKGKSCLGCLTIFIGLFIVMFIVKCIDDVKTKSNESEKNQALLNEYNSNRELILGNIDKWIQTENIKSADSLINVYRAVAATDISKAEMKLIDLKKKIELKQLQKQFLSKSSLSDNELMRVCGRLVELSPGNNEYKQCLISAKKTIEQKNSQAQSAEKRKQELEKQFSAWDGSHIELERMIKKSMNDPKSYEHVETGYSDYGKFIIVMTKLRGKNAFGAMVLSVVKAKVYNDGRIVIIEQN